VFGHATIIAIFAFVVDQSQGDQLSHTIVQMQGSSHRSREVEESQYAGEKLFHGKCHQCEYTSPDQTKLELQTFRIKIIFYDLTVIRIKRLNYPLKQSFGQWM